MKLPILKKTFVWVVVSSPEQAKRMKKLKIIYDNKVLEGKIADRTHATADDIAKNNALIFTAKNLNKPKNTEQIEKNIEEHFGPKNAVNFFFKRDAKNDKHLGSYNIQRLNATIHKKFVKKSAKLLCKHVKFPVHPRILDTNAPNASELTRLGSSDVNTVLANTIEALENISTKENLQKDMMNEIFGIREEISTMKKKLRSKQK